MNKPTNEFDKAFLLRAQASGIELDTGKRWESFTAHHPKSVELTKKIMAADWLFCDDSFQWKVGGDGDSGESLMYALDIIFEMEEGK